AVVVKVRSSWLILPAEVWATTRKPFGPLASATPANEKLPELSEVVVAIGVLTSLARRKVTVRLASVLPSSVTIWRLVAPSPTGRVSGAGSRSSVGRVGGLVSIVSARVPDFGLTLPAVSTASATN